MAEATETTRLRLWLRACLQPVRPTTNEARSTSEITAAAGEADGRTRSILGVIIGAVLLGVVITLANCSSQPQPAGTVHTLDYGKTDSHTPAQSPALSSAVNAPPESIPPAQQAKFASIVQSFIPDYNAADTEVRKTNVRFERKDAIMRYFAASGGFRFEEWIGRVENLHTESDGKAAVSVNLRGSETVIKTWHTSFSDSSSNTMISRNDKLYPSLMEIKDGVDVTVSGTFILDYNGPDYIQEASLTEAGSMARPEFIVRFSQIKLGLPPPAGGHEPSYAPARNTNGTANKDDENAKGSRPTASAEPQQHGPFTMVVDSKPDCFHVVDDEVLCDARPFVHLGNRRRANFYIACDTASATCTKLASGESYVVEFIGDSSKYSECSARQSEYINAAFHKDADCIKMHATPRDLIYSLIPQGEEDE